MKNISESVAKPSSAAELPFLAKTGVIRTGESQLPGHYCNSQKMWVIETTEGNKPIIEKGVLAQLLTKTRVQEENDDESFYQLDLLTKTMQQLEGDDDRAFGADNLLNLITKTNTTEETDDNFSASHFLELVTKTDVELESDDEGFGFSTFSDQYI